MAGTLVIDTSYGSTVGVLGHRPLVEQDSRTHVERLQPDIARAVADAGMVPADLDRIVVGIGPAPFTGLRAGIVAAKAVAYAVGAELVGVDALVPQAVWNDRRHGRDVSVRRLTLAVNDARRRQLYAALYDGPAADGDEPAVLMPMDIDYPDAIARRVDALVDGLGTDPERPVVVDVVGHGAARYASSWDAIGALGEVTDETALDQGADGLAIVAELAGRPLRRGAPVEPLYLRRPDAQVPPPLKHVLHHGSASRADGR